MTQMKQDIELLAPAGNRECLLAAINAGCDSVYIGLKDFSARSSARNFSIEELNSVVRTCHEKGVHVYLAMNTLVKNNEVQNFFVMLKKAYNCNIDAVIVQHLSFVPIIKQLFPGLKVHLSTQSNIENSYSAGLVKADRIILPRELNLDEIRQIKEKTDIELEVFCHGALCFCYSGQCLMSSIIGGRSGNRGKCAQPCRKRYNEKYLLSTKELCLIDSLPMIINAGIKCIKIEGRLKSPDYVHTTVSQYRKAIDCHLKGKKFEMTEMESAKLNMTFNRGFTKGHIMGSKDIIGDEKPMNRGNFLGQYHNGTIRLEEDLKVGDGISIWKNEKNLGRTIKFILLYGKNVQIAKKGATVKTNLEGADEGDKVYKTSEINPEKTKPIVYFRAPISLKRKQIERIVLPKTMLTSKNIDLKSYTEKENKVKIFVKVKNMDGLKDAVMFNPEVIYYDLYAKDALEAKGIVKKAGRGTRFFLFTRRILYNKALDDSIATINKIRPDGILASNSGYLNRKIKEILNCEIHVDYNLNAFNDQDIDFFQHLPIISPELNLSELRNFKSKDFCVFVHGRLIVMTTKCEVDERRLTDEKEITFETEKTGDYTTIYNSKEIGFFDEILKLKDSGINNYFLDLDKSVYKTLDIYRKILNKQPINTNKLRKGYTLGHLYRGVL